MANLNDPIFTTSEDGEKKNKKQQPQVDSSNVDQFKSDLSDSIDADNDRINIR